MQNEPEIKTNIPEWLTEEDACKVLNIKIKTLRQKCSKGEFIFKVQQNGAKFIYYIKFTSLATHIQKEYLKKFKDFQYKQDCYSEAPAWAKVQADKYINILNACENLTGKSLIDFVEKWNYCNPSFQTSYSSIRKMRQRYKEFGINGLLAQYGKRGGSTVVDDRLYEYFKNLYLKEGAPSLYSCWEQTKGYAIREEIELNEFPSHHSFRRRLEKEIPKQAIYLARYGYSAWNRKYSNYIERDYSNIICGKVWVSDHAQIDIACLTETGESVFPWVTAWRDFKSSKWLGWLLQTGHPNSDHIFQTFYYAAENYGLPTDVIIDNGKDYRCKDFAGGRKRITIDTNQAKATSMLSELNIKVHFAQPYNGQTKPIERDFLKIKELLSKHSVGYRGGNILERPEKLKEEIKKGMIMPFNEFKELFDDFVINVLNKKPSQGKVLKGLSPDELFNREFTEKITTSKDALKLFCMRTSRIFKIGRNGIKDNELGITYWADWMSARTDLKVYLRRDIKNYKEAWVFRADNDEFIGNVSAMSAVAALDADMVSKDEFKAAMSAKKRNLKIAKEFIKQTQDISLKEQCENYKALYKQNLQDIKPKISRLANTNMDKAVQKSKLMAEMCNLDLSVFEERNKVKDEHLFLFETDCVLEQESKGA
uniref:Transposase n=1 Tax=Siphoviridae sp. ctwQT14 TaxID=2827971 RepID=A0A8S5TK51_9CAUD|nr:MAG TPA: transposase [Siphoviridae sp. ctwQT14]